MQTVILLVLLFAGICVLTLQIAILRQRGAKLGREFRVLGGLGGLLALLALGYALGDVLNPFFGALLLAYALNPAVRWFEGRGLKRLYVVVGFTILAFILLVTAVTFALVSTYRSYDYWRFRVVGGAFEDRNANGAWDASEPFVAGQDAQGSGLLHHPGILAQVAASAPIPKDWLDDVLANLKPNLDKVLIGVRDVAAFMGESVFGRLFRLASLFILVPFYTFFLLLEFESVVAAVRAHLPGTHRDRIVSMAKRIDLAVAAFVRGRLVIAIIKGTLTGLGFALVGVDLAWLIGVVCAVLSLIPVAGPTAGFLLGSLFAYAPEGWLVRVALVIGVLVAVEGVEAALAPFLLGKGVGLHPVSYVLALLVFGQLFGLFGLLLAVPMAAVVKVLFLEFGLPPLKNLAAEGGANSSPG